MTARARGGAANLREVSRSESDEGAGAPSDAASGALFPPKGGLSALDARSREVFRRLVETYMRDGDPVGSRTLARAMGRRLSPATLRNVMSDLEAAGLLSSPHASAGRVPTDQGLRLFVGGLMERDNLTSDEKREIDASVAAAGGDPEAVLRRASDLLSDLSQCAGLVAAPEAEEESIRHVEFVRLSPERALVVLVTGAGHVENRILPIPPDLPPYALVEAGNYLSSHFGGSTLREAKERIASQVAADRAHLDALTGRLVQEGLATWSGDPRRSSLIVSGHARLLARVRVDEDLERVRELFATLERKESLLRLLRLADGAQGVQIFIGAQNRLFSLAGCALIVAPCLGEGRAPVGAIGVIGPARLDYARIIPMVDYTAQVVNRLRARLDEGVLRAAD